MFLFQIQVLELMFILVLPIWQRPCNCPSFFYLTCS